MLTPKALVAGLRVGRLALSVPRLSEGAAVGTVAFVIYLAAGAILAIGFNFIVGDAWSRVTNAYYVLFSRDPHLAAIGFVWNPLPSLMAIPILPLKAVFPALTTIGFVANIYSAIFMAGAVYLMWRIFVELGVTRWIRLLIVAAFAVHPMIIQYGANGMTEALFIFLILGEALYLIRWQRNGDLVPLVFAGVFLGVAYLVRYEAVAIGMSTGLLVMIVGFLMATGSWRFRAKASLADGIVFGAPLALVFVLWAGVSWLIVGSPFEQFGSVYGTTSQLSADYENIIARASDGEASIAFITGHLLILEPGLMLIGLAAALLALWRRDVRILPILGIFGAVLAFAVAAYMTGKTGGWVRYYITVIPLTVLLAGTLFGRRETQPDWLLEPLGWLRHPVESLRRTPAALWLQRPRQADPAHLFLAAGPASMSTAIWSTPMAPAPRQQPAGHAGLLVTALVRVNQLGASAARFVGWPEHRRRATALRGRLRTDRIRSDLAIVAIGLLLMPLISTPIAMVSPRFNYPLEFQTDAGRVHAAAAIGQALDAMDLPDGSVLLDVFLGFGIVVNSDNPRQFVITPDRDFKAILADPKAYAVKYLLVPPTDKELGQLDALNRQYPTLYNDGAGIATLVRQFDTFLPYYTYWRLYRVNE